LRAQRLQLRAVGLAHRLPPPDERQAARRPGALGWVALPFRAMVIEAVSREPVEKTVTRPGRMTVIYDSECGVCRDTVRHLRRWDHDQRFEFMPLRDAETCGRPALARLVAEGRLSDAVHVVDEATGSIVSGGHASLAILDALPGGWLLRPWAALPTTAAAAEVVYRVASRHRDRVAWLTGLRDEVSCPIRPATPDLAGPGSDETPAG
jgi:predicted DCC family thiol-disulfide oxidoreductase YuxK